jgi:gliding motility-associated-like protein
MHRLFFLISILFTVSFPHFLPGELKAQCLSTISTYPYAEDFETGTGGWNSGGLSNDWACGIPGKAYITTAGSGTRCWVTGGLNGSFYSLGQRSWVQSPCFDFSTLQHPFVSMKLFWEGENQYDGTTFQYSLNNGQTWINVGSTNDPVNCLNTEWFNTSNITALNTLATPREGWAGTVQPTAGGCFGGNGSGGWVEAKHCMPYLAGQPQVQFRFAFGAGTICNAFDGFAFDDIRIGEAPSNSADFTVACAPGTSLGYTFTQNAAFCPDGFSWDFGDPASGAANLGSGPSAQHTFSAPGTYTVTLTVSGPCNAPASISKTIQTLDLSLSGVPPGCAGGLPGSIASNGSGGASPLTYTLLPGTSVSATGLFNGLGPGTYTVTVGDAGGCTLSSTIGLVNPSAPEIVSAQSAPALCFGEASGSIAVQAAGSQPIQSYTLLPGNLMQSNGSFSNLLPGSYTIVAIDAAGCSNISTLVVESPPALKFTKTSFTMAPCGDTLLGTLDVQAEGGTFPYRFLLLPDSVGGTGSIAVKRNGTKTIRITDARDCILQTEINIPERICCDGVWMPDAFTPNNDGLNDELRPMGLQGTLLKHFRIMNRWGQTVFFAQHEEDRWDGTLRGMPCDVGTYFYLVDYTCLSNGKAFVKKGNFLLMR